MNLWCIHGNLQRPQVWDAIEEVFLRKVSMRKAIVQLRKPSIWDFDADSIHSWASMFLSYMESVAVEPEQNWLMGYSLGGRLAMHALIQKPHIWQGAIIVASHPGYMSIERKNEQIRRDEKWAEKFKYESWGVLLEEWNRLPVFGNRYNQNQLEEETISRDIISRAFIVYSKGRQEYLVPDLKKIKVPILYVAGEEDQKYTSIGLELSNQCHSVSFRSIENACHRVPWENTEMFVEVIQQFIDEIG